MPGRLRLALAGLAILPATVGHKRKQCKRCVVAGGFDFGVSADESNESGSILIHDVVLLFCSRCLSGHPKASGAAPKDKVCFFGGAAKASAGPPEGGGGATGGPLKAEAEDHSSAGRG